MVDFKQDLVVHMWENAPCRMRSALARFLDYSQTNAYGRRIVERGMSANFFVHYKIDDGESKRTNKLGLEEHGHQPGEVPGAGVLLEQEA